MIFMNAFTREPESLVQAQIEAVARVMRSGWWILGKEVEAFEAAWSEFSGCACTIGVANGMDALEIGLRALGIGPGDEVITTPMTAFATVLAILRAGATPVFADIEPDTANLSVDSAARCMSSRTRAIMVVHLYGQAASLNAFEALCQSQGIHLIEDCAQAHGAWCQGRPVGSVGIFAGWSFYPTKNLGTIGDGGALSTNSLDLDALARQLRNYGQSVRYHHPHQGLNSRLDELHAAILLERLKCLAPWTAKRREVAHCYTQALANPLVRVLPLPQEAARHVHHLFVVTSPKRDALAAYLKAAGVETLIHYPVAAHFQEPCKKMRRDPQGLVAAEKHAAEALSLPCNPFLEQAEVSRVIDAVNSFRG